MFIVKKSHLNSLVLATVAACSIGITPGFGQNSTDWQQPTQSGLSQLRSGHVNQARHELQRALDAAKQSSNSHISDAVENLALCEEMNGRYDRALSDYQQVFDTRRNALAGDGAMAEILGNVARVQTLSGNYLDAHRSFTRASDLISDSGSPSTKARIYNDFARYYLAIGQNAAAIPLSRDAVSYSQKAADKRLMAETFNTAALVALSQSDLAGAEQQATNSLIITQADREHYVFSIADSSVILARVNLERNQPDKALSLINNAWAMRVNAVGRFHGSNAECVYLSGIAALQQGDINAAEQFFQQSLSLKQSAFGLRNPQSAPDYLGLATCKLLRGNLEEGKMFYQKATELHVAPQQDSLNSAYLAYFSHQLWLSNHVLAAVQFKADKIKQAGTVPVWDIDAHLLQTTMQQPDASSKFPQAYSMHNIMLCTIACMFPMLVIAIMLWMPHLFSVPHNSGFEEFQRDAERNKRRARNVRDQINQLPLPMPTQTQATSQKSTGKLSLKPQREIRLPERNK
jgi:tetratricopeptide (TPR) repeat protein